MNDNSYIGVGFVLGLVVSVLISSLPMSNSSLYKKAIEECEKSLPRDKHCKVIGVVDEDK